MKAIQIQSYGDISNLTLSEIPKPNVGSDEVLIKVRAAGINPVDWKIAEGYLKEFLPHQLPLTLGWDVAGEIAELGDQVSDFKVGDAVYTRPEISRDGGFAEYIVVKANEVAGKPKSASFAEAAAVPLAALTAWQGLFDVMQLEPGATVLIHAAAGGVGHFAVQIAKAKGLRVIGTASARNQEFLKEIGVDEFIDYTKTDFSEVLKDIDAVYDTIGGETLEKSFKVIRPGGALVSIVAPPPEKLADESNVKAGYLFVQPHAAQLAEIAQLIDDGKIKIHIDRTLPLSEAAQALQLSKEGHVRGKLILDVDGASSR
ncbi:NADP-dependent oxidoreductase [Pseudobacteriovorax antillogorgiicola]|uniref:NADPH:quinone reductase n=1 Tax=Pseudobacteriovorax antillogorgiicola TaxID=1513793 RepID=A0A1Y6CQD7_9BACT|nr:NADP-dependent oxidoreductase [Pseudobacteriovorax antillogorgiicola]TCS43496.1 NADPH:quinone reductase-like Zn-dependent oxidoreductase [Pseudobacteriovorax antillogorgiicola]SMF81174.1 NADPH:quinone reductase [Pseudobacteriovorax antillogorgiicola]